MKAIPEMCIKYDIYDFLYFMHTQNMLIDFETSFNIFFLSSHYYDSSFPSQNMIKRIYIFKTKIHITKIQITIYQITEIIESRFNYGSSNNEGILSNIKTSVFKKKKKKK